MPTLHRFSEAEIAHQEHLYAMVLQRLDETIDAIVQEMASAGIPFPEIEATILLVIANYSNDTNRSIIQRRILAAYQAMIVNH